MAEPIPDLCQALVFSSIHFFSILNTVVNGLAIPENRATWRGKNKGGQGSDSEFVITMYTYVKVG